MSDPARTLDALLAATQAMPRKLAEALASLQGGPRAASPAEEVARQVAAAGRPPAPRADARGEAKQEAKGEAPRDPGSPSFEKSKFQANEMFGVRYSVAKPPRGHSDVYGAGQDFLGALTPFLPGGIGRMAGKAADWMGKGRHLANTWNNLRRQWKRASKPPGAGKAARMRKQRDGWLAKNYRPAPFVPKPPARRPPGPPLPEAPRGGIVAGGRDVWGLPAVRDPGSPPPRDAARVPEGAQRLGAGTRYDTLSGPGEWREMAPPGRLLGTPGGDAAAGGGAAPAADHDRRLEDNTQAMNKLFDSVSELIESNKKLAEAAKAGRTGQTGERAAGAARGGKAEGGGAARKPSEDGDSNLAGSLLRLAMMAGG